MTIRTLMIGAAALTLPAAAFAQAVTPPAGSVAETPAAAAGAVSTGQTVDGVTDPATQATTDTASTATVAASAADVVAGKAVVDTKGGSVGTIEKVDANGAVIATGTARVQIPVTSFAKNDRALVISTTKAELEAAAKASSPS